MICSLGETSREREKSPNCPRANWGRLPSTWVKINKPLHLRVVLPKEEEDGLWIKGGSKHSNTVNNSNTMAMGYTSGTKM